MTAYHGLQDPSYNRLLRQSERSQLPATNGQLETAAPSPAVAEQWIQLSNNLHYTLVSACDGPASTICRQNAQGNGFETWRLQHLRCSIPLGTRSVGYLTRLLIHSLMNRSSKKPLQHGVSTSLMIDSGAATPVCAHHCLQHNFHYSASSMEQDHNCEQ